MTKVELDNKAKEVSQKLVNAEKLMHEAIITGADPIEFEEQYDKLDQELTDICQQITDKEII